MIFTIYHIYHFKLQWIMDLCSRSMSSSFSHPIHWINVFILLRELKSQPPQGTVGSRKCDITYFSKDEISTMIDHICTTWWATKSVLIHLKGPYTVGTKIHISMILAPRSLSFRLKSASKAEFLVLCVPKKA